jgi:CheY-like chemotaxis protein
VVELFQPGELAGAKILVVEDDRDARELLVEFLETCGATVLGASSESQALTRFREMRPLVILSDTHMPGGCGFALVRAIRTLPPEEGGLTPAIAMSSASDPFEVIRAGFHVYLPKPFDPLRLLDAVRAFVHEGIAGRAAWTLTMPEEGVIVLRWSGHIGPADMRNAVPALACVLRDGRGYQIVLDLREVKGIDLAARSVAERGLWDVRHAIVAVVVVGGTALGRAVVAAGCALLGVKCRFADAWPEV